MQTITKTYEVVRAFIGPGWGKLIIDTEPVKGQVYVNDTLQGIAPVTLDNLPPIEYVISFGGVEGYITPEDITLTLEEGEEREVTGEYIPGEEEEERNWLPWVAGGGFLAFLAVAVAISKRG